MKAEIPVHVYIDDGAADVDGNGRCVGCGLPERNQRHQLPDKADEMNEHRRRAGEGSMRVTTDEKRTSGRVRLRDLADQQPADPLGSRAETGVEPTPKQTADGATQPQE